MRDVPDPRVDRRRLHDLGDILTIGVCAVVCGADTFVEMEEFGLSKEGFGTFLGLPNGIPSHDTFRAVFMAIDPEHFLEAFLRWTEAVRTVFCDEVIALDGKALRGAVEAGQNPRYIVGAWATDNGLALGQLKVARKSNEITALPDLLEVLSLKGCIVTADAMGCQRKVAEKIREQGADYVLALKGNQENLHLHVSTYFKELIERRGAAPEFEEAEPRRRGRQEVRRCWVEDDLSWLEGRGDWRGIRSVAAVELERTEKARTTVERRYFISSLPAEAGKIARAARSHWGIENSLHWVLDVAYGEDASRARSGNAPENLATLRRLTLNMIKKAPSHAKASLKTKRKKAGWDNSYLAEILGQNLNA